MTKERRMPNIEVTDRLSDFSKIEFPVLVRVPRKPRQGIMFNSNNIIVQLLSSVNNNNEMKTIKRDNVEINYQVTGKGDTTLIFVHGSYINQEYWKNAKKGKE